MNPEIVAAFPRDIAMVISTLAGFVILGFAASKVVKLVASVLFDQEQADGHAPSQQYGHGPHDQHRGER